MNKKWMVLGLLLLGSTLQAGDCSDTSFHDIDDPILNNMLESCRDINNYPSLSTNSSSATTLPNSPIASATTAQNDQEQGLLPLGSTVQAIDDPILNNMLESCSDINNYKLPQIEPSISTLSSRSSQKRKATDSDDFVVLSQMLLPSITTATLSTSTQPSKKKGGTLICDYIVDPETGGICGKRFKQKSRLTEHIRTHTGEKPFECNQCDKRFTQSRHLTLHTKIHTGERPYQCNYVNQITNRACGDRFLLSSSLTDHTRTHTGEKPYECTSCKINFSTNSGRARHIETKKHKNNVIKVALQKEKP